MSKRHEGKTMLVTGAAGVIGYATSEILAREGGAGDAGRYRYGKG